MQHDRSSAAPTATAPRHHHASVWMEDVPAIQAARMNRRATAIETASVVIGNIRQDLPFASKAAEAWRQAAKADDAAPAAQVLAVAALARAGLAKAHPAADDVQLDQAALDITMRVRDTAAMAGRDSLSANKAGVQAGAIREACTVDLANMIDPPLTAKLATAVGLNRQSTACTALAGLADRMPIVAEGLDRTEPW